MTLMTEGVFSMDMDKRKVNFGNRRNLKDDSFFITSIRILRIEQRSHGGPVSEWACLHKYHMTYCRFPSYDSTTSLTSCMRSGKSRNAVSINLPLQEALAHCMLIPYFCCILSCCKAGASAQRIPQQTLNGASLRCHVPILSAKHSDPPLRLL